MCDIPLLNRLIATAHLSFGTAIGFIIAAAAKNNDLLHAWQSPVLMSFAIIGLGGAIAALVAASQAAALCAGPCGAQTAKLVIDINAMVAALAAIMVAAGLAALIAGIPYIAQLAISGILTGLLAAGAFGVLIASDLATLATCAAAPPKSPTLVALLGPLLLIVVGALVLTSLGGVAPIPFAPR